MTILKWVNLYMKLEWSLCRHLVCFAFWYGIGIFSWWWGILTQITFIFSMAILHRNWNSCKCKGIPTYIPIGYGMVHTSMGLHGGITLVVRHRTACQRLTSRTDTIQCNNHIYFYEHLQIRPQINPNAKSHTGTLSITMNSEINS